MNWAISQIGVTCILVSINTNSALESKQQGFHNIEPVHLEAQGQRDNILFEVTVLD